MVPVGPCWFVNPNALEYDILCVDTRQLQDGLVG